ncbi:MAG: hypothetical protein ACPGLV_02910, partial [Bacteroidia bacterium]
DTVGQRAYFNQHRSDYMWKERAEVVVFYCKDKSVADKVKGELADDNSNLSELYKAMNKDNSMTFSYTKDVVEKGDKEEVDKVAWEKGYHTIDNFKDRYVLIKIDDVKPSQYKKLNEIKGLVIADYQTYLENNWIDKLKKKYEINVNQPLIDSLVKE